MAFLPKFIGGRNSDYARGADNHKQDLESLIMSIATRHSCRMLVKRSSSLLATLLTVLTPVIAVSAPEIGRQAQALKGSASLERPEVGLLLRPGHSCGPDAAGCTATLITDRHFVTAAHCISFAPISRGGALCLDINGGREEHPIQWIFGKSHRRSYDKRDWDWAVGRLSTPVPENILYPDLATRQPASGEILTAVGYGCTERRSAALGLGSKRILEYAYDGRTDIHCGGDSGGPTFLGSLASRGPIVRIHSGRRACVSNLFSGCDIGVNVVAARNAIFALIHAFEDDGVCYRVHVRDGGWLAPVCNGREAGTTGQSRQIEAIQIWTARPGVSVCYAAHVERRGWQKEVCDGDMAGTTGEDLRLEGLRIKLVRRSPRQEQLQYQGYVEDKRWQPVVGEGSLAGTEGEHRRMEGIRIWMVNQW